MVMLFCIVSEAKSLDVRYEIKEDSPPGALIGNIPDSIDLSSLVPEANIPSMRFNFLQSDSEYLDYFKLDPLNGDLCLSDSKILDRETICEFDTTCVKKLLIAIKSIRTQFFRTVSVYIDILDVNDHTPMFEQTSTTITISESVQVPSDFILPSATDRDSGGNNSIQEYEIVPADGPFELSYNKDKPNSMLMLRVVKQLDHEKTESYSVRIVARDGGSPQREGILNVEIVVEDVNDNAPIFTPEFYEKVIDETVQQGSILVTLTATDADSGKNGEVQYMLSPLQAAEIKDMFSVDAESGELRLVGDLQEAETDTYRVGVEARDRADQPFTTETMVLITVEDTINSPPRLILSTLSQEEFSTTSEYANLGVAVAHLQVKDTDRGPNGIVTCNLTTPGFFELQNMDVNAYTVIVARHLDREDTSIHNLTVACYDAGEPPLKSSKSFQVHVTDENDEYPVFEQSAFRVSVIENNARGEEILTVTATDKDDPATKNGQITYSLRGENNTFAIGPNSGVITAVKSFDFETMKSFNFTVVAKDNGIPQRSALAAVMVTILDVNDVAPNFTHDKFTVRISEYASPGDVIGEISALESETGDNGRIEITIVPGSARRLRQYFDTDAMSDFEDISDDSLPFVMRYNGSIVLTRPLDHETCSQYQFEVLATDKGKPPLSSAAVVVIHVVDENDNPPRILHPNISEAVFTAYAGKEAPKTLTVFKVRDADSGSNGIVTYAITARNDSGRFEIDQLNGAVKRTRDLTGSDGGVYKLSVMVRDAGIPPLSDVRTLLIHVSGNTVNGTASGSSDNEERYVVIALTLVCITVLLSVTIVLVIVIMRRLDRRRKLHGGGAGRHVTDRTGNRGPMHIQNSAFMDPVKMDNFKNDQADRNGGGGSGGFGGNIGEGGGSENEKRLNDSQFGFSPTTAGSMNSKSQGGDNGYQVSMPLLNFNERKLEFVGW
ncbi:protocadherin-9 [Elysia marginata]|uniref:Protocadherin-9 n=1 Tax=Elysia marginata TaxID=1093978 RepID=A0AAV4J1I7_9GAST|nr:protocadherin-9 [Elysia marginata]